MALEENNPPQTYLKLSFSFKIRKVSMTIKHYPNRRDNQTKQSENNYIQKKTTKNKKKKQKKKNPEDSSEKKTKHNNPNQTKLKTKIQLIEQ